MWLGLVGTSHHIPYIYANREGARRVARYQGTVTLEIRGAGGALRKRELLDFAGLFNSALRREREMRPSLISANARVVDRYLDVTIELNADVDVALDDLADEILESAFAHTTHSRLSLTLQESELVAV